MSILLGAKYAGSYLLCAAKDANVVAASEPCKVRYIAAGSHLIRVVMHTIAGANCTGFGKDLCYSISWVQTAVQ